ncbi:DNA-binding protein [Virgibacillus phasianinus]|uniref:DNA-binding protein n=1 Tax=Virgibacillus phasianinus TaxID=2017483 RepID=A0A220U019_9BACI|nr:DNA-binding protein [Virgibacillus phasianinus]ASK61389.1 DNA-binding protein [Virgibacillus phasianinus]
MFETTLKPQPEFENKMYDMMYQIAEKAQQDRDQLNDFPYLLSKTQLAKHVFNVSTQTLDAHIVRRSDFPKINVGDRVLYPKDDAIKWIKDHIDLTNDTTMERKLLSL